jgi:penicillin amidase
MNKRGLFPRVLHLLIALLVAGGVLYVTAAGAGPLPPLGSALNPGTGVWTSADAARPLQSETLHFADLQQTVTIIFEANGTPHIQAATDNDLFWAIGYLQARFRLTQMDLLRRQGEGLLAQILGPQALSSDQLQVMLGLERAAQRNWQTLPANSPICAALQAFSNGVNAWINQAEGSNALPFMFKLLNYRPQPWTPLDSLVIQGVMTQDLDFSTTPLDYALLVKALGYERTMQWFPVLPPDIQHPYATGPYPKAASNPTPLPAQLALGQPTMQSIASIDQQIQAQPNALRDGPASNNWAVNGPLTTSGKALMAGDPHLHLTLPAIWYQLDARSPGYTFSGVSIPGVPLVLIGRNQHISWSMTDVQNESTLFYVEKTDRAHPHQYYWNGAWQSMQHLVYTIPVKGRASVRQDVYLTVHGPIFPADQGLAGETLSVDWMGALPSTDSEALMGMLKAANFSEFRDALSKWTAPTLNFVYADDQGNIGMISPGYYPVVKAGAPWLPLPGTGEADIAGSIPYSAVPQVYDPPNHMVFSANQRPVGNNYPYYIGTTWNDFDNGYRADEIAAELSSGQKLTMQDMERMQNSTHDYLAGLIVPQLLKTLQANSLNATAQQAQGLLASWNENMDVASPAASIWWTFWTRYLLDTFGPWWQARHVPVAKHPDLAIGTGQTSLDEDLEAWTLYDPTNAPFTLPNGTRRSAGMVMLQAFQESVAELSKALGNDPNRWQWGKLHTRTIASLLGADELTYGPRASGGDEWTLNAVGGSPLSQNSPLLSSSEHGPSWRIIVDWGSVQAEGTYPGGQDENPASPWYENEISHWWNGQYYPMIDGATARTQPGSVTWTLSK